MIIEFADPGFNWAFVWWPLGILLAGLILFFLPFAVVPVRRFEEWMPGPGFIIVALGFFLLVALVPTEATVGYGSRVDEATVTALEAEGFASVSLDGDRFTADLDGAFFSGALIDLEPESGYAYAVTELTSLTKD